MFIPYTLLIPALSAAVTYYYSLHVHPTPPIPSPATFQTNLQVSPIPQQDPSTRPTNNSSHILDSTEPMLLTNPLTHKE